MIRRSPRGDLPPDLERAVVNPAAVLCMTGVAFFLAGLALGGSVAWAAPHAHSHGTGQLDIAVEGNRITIRLESPLDNLVGFERAPRSEQERRKVDTALNTLKAGDTLFSMDPAAGCKLVSAELSSAVLGLGTPRPGQAGPGHADIEGSFEYGCADAAKLSRLEHRLFQFDRLRRLEVRVSTPKGQFKRDLNRPASRVDLRK